MLVAGARSARATCCHNPDSQNGVAIVCTEHPVTLTPVQRLKVEAVCREHANVRGWALHAIQVRSNHIHLVVAADKAPKTVRDQFKANATRVLREAPEPITNQTVWTQGGDCEVIDGEENLERVVQYVLEAQDRMDRKL